MKETDWSIQDNPTCPNEVFIKYGLVGYIGVGGARKGRQDTAERIVACVNACKNIPNAALEAGVIGEMVEYIKSRKDKDLLGGPVSYLLTKLEASNNG